MLLVLVLVLLVLVLLTVGVVLLLSVLMLVLLVLPLLLDRHYPGRPPPQIDGQSLADAFVPSALRRNPCHMWWIDER